MTNEVKKKTCGPYISYEIFVNLLSFLREIITKNLTNILIMMMTSKGLMNFSEILQEFRGERGYIFMASFRGV